MLRIYLLLSLTLFSTHAFTYERLSLYRLILSPDTYEGKKVYLTGYFITDGADCLVIANDKETALMFREYEMVKCISPFLKRTLIS